MAGPLLGPAGKGSQRYRRGPISEINVVPFIDVMLVLLVVFMITAPMLTQGVDVALPEVESAPVSQENEPIAITVKRNGVVFIHEREVEMKDLYESLHALKETRPETAILLRADKNVEYGSVMQVMGALQKSGLVNVSMVTEPVSGR